MKAELRGLRARARVTREPGWWAGQRGSVTWRAAPEALSVPACGRERAGRREPRNGGLVPAERSAAAAPRLRERALGCGLRAGSSSASPEAPEVWKAQVGLRPAGGSRPCAGPQGGRVCASVPSPRAGRARRAEKAAAPNPSLGDETFLEGSNFGRE